MFHDADCPRQDHGVVNTDSFNGIYRRRDDPRPNNNPLKCPANNYIGNGQVNEVGVECVNRGDGNPVAWTTGHEDGYWDPVATLPGGAPKPRARRYICPPGEEHEIQVRSFHPIDAQYRCEYKRPCQPIPRPVKKKSRIGKIIAHISGGNKHGNGPHRVADQEAQGRAEYHNAYGTISITISLSV